MGAAPAAAASEEPPTPFQFLRISTLREYLEKEFAVGDYTCAGGFNLERVIDDFIFLCFFVGNDFLPHMPSLDIRDGAIDTLCHLYRAAFSLLGGWITDGGEVDLQRAQIFCRELGRMEDELLRNRRRTELRMKQRDREKQAERVADASGRKACERRYSEMSAQLAACARLPAPSPHLQAMGHPPAAGVGVDPARVLGRDAQLFRLFQQIVDFAAKPDGAPPEPLPSGMSPFERAKAYQCCDEYGVAHESKGRGGPNQSISLIKRDGEKEPAGVAFKRQIGEIMKKKSELPEQPDEIALGEAGGQERYYAHKFPQLADATARAAVALAFAEGLCWVMRYYYDGCRSWQWFYPYHYAPFAADIASAIDPAQPFPLKLGAPFLPFQQLMGVLPPRSAHALPAPLAELMCDTTSPIADFYPTEFELDLNGKKFAWQAVILLPFIDEARLTAAMAPRLPGLEPDEWRRNRHGEG